MHMIVSLGVGSKLLHVPCGGWFLPFFNTTKSKITVHHLPEKPKLHCPLTPTSISSKPIPATQPKTQWNQWKEIRENVQNPWAMGHFGIILISVIFVLMQCRRGSALSFSIDAMHKGRFFSIFKAFKFLIKIIFIPSINAIHVGLRSEDWIILIFSHLSISAMRMGLSLYKHILHGYCNFW